MLLYYFQALCDQQRYEEADKNFKKALSLEPDNGNFYVHRGYEIDIALIFVKVVMSPLSLEGCVSLSCIGKAPM